MKILRVSPSYYPATKYGGSISADFNLDKETSEKHDLNVVTTNAGLKSIKINKWFSFNNLKVIYLSFIGYEHFNFSLSFLFFLVKNIKKYDLLHISGVWNFPSFIAPILARFFKVPYIITLHGALFEAAFNAKKRIFKKILFKLIVKKNLIKSSAVHVTSYKEAEELNKFININLLNVAVIPFGIPNQSIKIKIKDIKEFRNKYDIKSYEKIILFVGRVHPIKGLDLLFKTFNEIIKVKKDIRLFIVGPYDTKYKLSLMNLLSNEAKIKVCFTGMLEGKDKELIFINSDVFVLLSYSENLGMVVIEAMQHRLPIIIGNNVGISSLIKNVRGIDIVDYDIKQIKSILLNKVCYQINDEKIKEHIYDSYIRLFDIKQVSERFIKLYKESINQ